MVQSENHQSAGFPSSSYSANPSLVKIENDDGRLRLRFTHAGKRYSLAIGLPDSRVNRLVAQQKAAQIELDIASGNFDFTLSKYKPPKQPNLKHQEITVSELFQQFTEYQSKNKELQPGSLCRYTTTLKHLEYYFSCKAVKSIDQNDAEGFTQYLRRQVSTRTAKDYLILIQACWNWAEQNVVVLNK